MLPVVLRAMDRYASPKAAYAAIGLIFLAQAVAADIASGLYARLYAPGMETAEAFDQWFTQVLPAYRLGDFCDRLQSGVHIHEQPRKASAAATAFEAAAVLVWAAAEFASLSGERGALCQHDGAFHSAVGADSIQLRLRRGYISRALTNRAAKAHIRPELGHISYTFRCHNDRQHNNDASAHAGGAQKLAFVA